MDVLKEDVQTVDVTEQGADRVRWRRMIRCGDPCRKRLKEEDKNVRLSPPIVTVFFCSSSLKHTDGDGVGFGKQRFYVSSCETARLLQASASDL